MDDLTEAENNKKKLELKMFYETQTARKPPSACTAVTPSPAAATEWCRLLLLAAYGARLTMHCQWG